jgi:hypothetical protein
MNTKFKMLSPTNCRDSKTDAVKPKRWRPAGLMSLILIAPAVSQAIDFGPDGMFSITGFAEVSLTYVNNQCPSGGCQFSPETDRQRVWADDVVPGRQLGTRDVTFTQVQPYFGFKYDLGKGYKFNALYSQRWRDGSPDVPGFVYEQNVAVSHEDYGRLAIGHMTSRTWNLADYPYASNLSLASTWAASGAGYRMLTQAIRYTSRVFDVANGDLVLEATYDRGDTAFKIHKPRFFELWAHYGKGPLSLDATYQDTRNGGPVAWGLAPFKAPGYQEAADSKVGDSGQSMAMLQAIYQYSPKIELSGAIRHNRWSGAYAAVIDSTPPAQWNNMWNVDWGGTLNGVANPGYSATSTDWSAGALYRMDKWTFSTGVAHLGRASTNNPSERGQSNSVLVNTIRASYNYGKGVQFYATGGVLHYDKQGLSPLSLPSNASIENIDSRVTRDGNWFGVGAIYTF